MIFLFAAFLVSFITNMLIIRLNHLHEKFSSDSDLSGPQKFHTNIVPRIGGISIAISLLIVIFFGLGRNTERVTEITLLICAIPTFAIGLTEDLTKKISVRLRLLFSSTSAILFIFLIPAQITKLDLPYLDPIISFPIIGASLTILAITGLANAYNIIDGFNGLASMVGIITLLSIAYISFIVADPLILYLSLIMASAILGVFFWNYPRGHIFLGDGGAYLIGFWIACLSILLTNRHAEISPWFALLINGYPIAETLFTIYRRKIHQGKSPGQADGLHIHTLLYRRALKKHILNDLSRNYKTSPFLWILTLVAIIPSLFWWNSSEKLIACSVLYLLFYIFLYIRIIRFQTLKNPFKKYPLD